MKQHSFISQSINSLKAILALSALLITSPSFAQNNTPESHINYEKSATYDYGTGQGLITLQSYVDGEIVERPFAKAADIVLVLDVSNSMCPQKNGTSSDRIQSVGQSVYLFGGDQIGYLHEGTSRTNDVKKSGTNDYKTTHNYKTLTPFKVGGNSFLRYTIQLGGTGTMYNLAYFDNTSGKNGWYYSTSNSTTSGTWTKYTANSADDKLYTDVRLDILENACRELIDIIYANPADNGAHKISVVTWASKGSPIFNLGLTAATTANKETLRNSVTFLDTGPDTYACVGLKQALTNLGSSSSDREKLVLFFTDGEPNNKFADIVNDAKALKDKGAKVFSVALVADDTAPAAVWNTPETAMNIKTYLEYVSSLYPKATGTLSSNKSNITKGDKNTDGVDYYHCSTNGSDLVNIFKTIGGMAFTGGAGIEDLDPDHNVYLKDRINMAQCVLVETDGTDIKTYTADCTGKSGDDLTFGNPVEVTGLTVTVNSSDDSQSIDVAGFDYSGNWCGYDAENEKYRGKKLIITIPFKLKAPGSGTFNEAETNLSGSSLYKGTEPVGGGFPIPKIKFTEVTIQKYGLKAGDSAVYIVKKGDVEITRVVLTGTDDSGSMVSTKLRILEPNVEYSVTETWWDYTYTLTSKDVTDNVFTFNSAKTSGMENEAEHRKVNDFK